MNDWLHSLPLAWMALVVFGATYIVGALIQAIVAGLAVGERARSFKAVSPGRPLGHHLRLVRGLYGGAGLERHRSRQCRGRAGSQRAEVGCGAGREPAPDAELRLRSLVRSYIEETTASEWPLMAQGAATLKSSPATLTNALSSPFPCRRAPLDNRLHSVRSPARLGKPWKRAVERILVSRSEVNATKWACLILQAICALFAIAVVHSDNRLASALAIGAFATGVAASLLLILSHDRPFVGTIAVRPDALMQVMPGRRKAMTSAGTAQPRGSGIACCDNSCGTNVVQSHGVAAAIGGGIRATQNVRRGWPRDADCLQLRPEDCAISMGRVAIVGQGIVGQGKVRQGKVRQGKVRWYTYRAKQGFDQLHDLALLALPSAPRTLSGTAAAPPGSRIAARRRRFSHRCGVRDRFAIFVQGGIA